MSYFDVKHAHNVALVEALHGSGGPTVAGLPPIQLERHHPLPQQLEIAPADSNIGPGWGSAHVIPNGASLIFPGLGDDAA